MKKTLESVGGAFLALLILLVFASLLISLLASGNPCPSHFPKWVYYVKIHGTGESIRFDFSPSCDQEVK